MRYNALAALRYNALSRSCILSFSVSSNQAHCLWFPQVGQETAPLGVNGCCHASFSIYLSAILHTCLSITCCSPQRTTTAHKISVSVRVKSEYAAYSLRLTGRASMQAGGYNEEGQCINAIARGKLGDLLSIEHWQVSENCCLEWICCEKNHRKLTRTKATGKSFVFKPGVQL